MTDAAIGSVSPIGVHPRRTGDTTGMAVMRDGQRV
jgi:hypothetical protein